MLKFTNGQDVYDDFDTEYKRHTTGYVILAPPGTGKTTFVSEQPGIKKDWIDSDSLFGDKSLNIRWEGQSTIEQKLCYLRADYMLEQSKIYGYKIIGSLFWKYKADAMVILPYEQHESYFSRRTDLSLSTIHKMREIFLDHSKEFQIPLFETIPAAIDYLEMYKI
tara:strand:+ start:820 stop:1314 length:495 start_codon:yes stop_codon:yes gene_type:complete